MKTSYKAHYHRLKIGPDLAADSYLKFAKQSPSLLLSRRQEISHATEVGEGHSVYRLTRKVAIVALGVNFNLVQKFKLHLNRLSSLWRKYIYIVYTYIVYTYIVYTYIVYAYIVYTYIVYIYIVYTYIVYRKFEML